MPWCRRTGPAGAAAIVGARSVTPMPSISPALPRSIELTRSIVVEAIEVSRPVSALIPDGGSTGAASTGDGGAVLTAAESAVCRVRGRVGVGSGISTDRTTRAGAHAISVLGIGKSPGARSEAPITAVSSTA